MEPYTYSNADRSWLAKEQGEPVLGSDAPQDAKQPLPQERAPILNGFDTMAHQEYATPRQAQPQVPQAQPAAAQTQPQAQRPAGAAPSHVLSPADYQQRYEQLYREAQERQAQHRAQQAQQAQWPAGEQHESRQARWDGARAAGAQQAYTPRPTQPTQAYWPAGSQGYGSAQAAAPNPYDNYEEFFWGEGTEMPRRKRHPFRTFFVLVTAAALAMMLWPQSPINYDILRGTSLHNLQEWAEQTFGLSFPEPSEEELEAIYSQDAAVDTEFILLDPPTTLDSTATARHYYRSALSEHAQTVYDALEAGLINMDEKIAIPAGTSTEELHTCWQFVLYDRSDIFWLPDDARLTYFTWGDSVAYIVPDYKYDPDTANALKAQFEEIAAVTPLLGDTQEQTMENICAYVADLTDYVNSENDQYVDSVFSNHESVCAGYSKAVQYLANRHGIPCIYLVGTATDYLGTGGSHAWVAANIDSEIRYFDPTWYDQRGWHADQFLGMNLAEISADHQADYPQLLPR